MILVFLGMQAYFYFPFQKFYWWEIDIEDSFLRTWALKVTDFLKAISDLEKPNKTHSSGESPQFSKVAPSPGSSMIIQGQTRPCWWLDFAHFVHYLCNMRVVRECGCRWFIGISSWKQIAEAQLLYLGVPHPPPPKPLHMLLRACPVVLLRLNPVLATPPGHRHTPLWSRRHTWEAPNLQQILRTQSPPKMWFSLKKKTYTIK